MNKRDKVRYTIQPDGKVVISRADQIENDPLLGQFLEFLAQDIEKNPQHLQPLNPELVDRARSLVSGVSGVEVDAPLADEHE